MLIFVHILSQLPEVHPLSLHFECHDKQHRWNAGAAKFLLSALNAKQSVTQLGHFTHRKQVHNKHQTRC